MSLLERLVGQTVLAVSEDIATCIPLNTPVPLPESGQAVITRVIAFEDYQLSIVNPVHVTGIDGPLELSSLKGKMVNRVEENEHTALIGFNDGLQLVIDLRDESFVGPEAMVLHGPDDLIVVWN